MGSEGKWLLKVSMSVTLASHGVDLNFIMFWHDKGGLCLITWQLSVSVCVVVIVKGA